MVIRIFLWIYVCNFSFGSLFRKTPSYYCENLNDSIHLKEKKRVLITLMHCLRYMIYAGRNIWMCCLYSKKHPDSRVLSTKRIKGIIKIAIV